MANSSTIHTTPSAPIACSLTAGGLAHRLAAIAGLNGAFLRAFRQDGRVLELTYELVALPQIRELIRQEAECCPFLGFELTAEGNLVQARISAPMNVPGSTAGLLAPFLVGADAQVCPGNLISSKSFSPRGLTATLPLSLTCRGL